MSPVGGKDGWLPVQYSSYGTFLIAGLSGIVAIAQSGSGTATWPGFVFKPADLRSAASVTAGVHTVAVSSVDLVAAFGRKRAAVYYAAVLLCYGGC